MRLLSVRVFTGLLLLISSFFNPACKQAAEIPAEDNDTLFALLDSAQTGLDFVNEVHDQEEFNVLTYRNFYNGGGVAIGDINQDGLPDIYFTANMQSNRLYINKGNWQFEDVTAQTGVGGTRAWSTGVSMADVNGDGLLDIYVCNSGDIAGDNKENELFINQGNLKFKEQAAEYGLNDEGFSTHASFFDYDGDGDLDCYVLNNSFKDPDRIDLYKKTREETDAMGGDKLFRNDGPLEARSGSVFTDVTAEAGIYSSAIGFGLGVSVSDVNGDLLPDIYISNDFWERDYLYINQGDGTFSEELPARISQTSVSSMGADVADLNNDGNPEIFSTDMLAADNYRLKAMTVFDPYHLEDIKYRGNYHYQILQNGLQLNNGDGRFQEIAFLANVAATDWSWGALIFDFDNDGWNDIFVCNGIYHDIMYMDFTAFISDKENIKKVVSEKGEFDWRDFLPYLPSNRLSNFAFVNQRDLTFASKAKELGLGTPSFSNGAAYGDLDQDGDLDLVINNVNMPCFVYKNQSREQNNNHFLDISLEGEGKNTFGVGTIIRVYSQGRQQLFQQYPSRGFESAIEPRIHVGLGSITQVDSIRVIWPDKRVQTLTAVQADQHLRLKQTDASVNPSSGNGNSFTLFTEIEPSMLIRGDTRHTENLYNDFDHERLLPRMYSTEGPRIVKGDINGDKLEDFILLGSANDPDKLFVQDANGRFHAMRQTAFEETDSLESTCGALFDADGDGDLDYLVGAGGNEYQRGLKGFLLRYYENDGKGRFTHELEKTPPAAGNFSCIKAEDFDLDGDMDLFIGSRIVPGNYGLIPQSFLIRNEGGKGWKDITPPFVSGSGMISDACWSDVNRDGKKDLIVLAEWAPVLVFPNMGQNLGEARALPNSSGWWTRIEKADLDGDGDEDFVLGNWGLNTKFKASPEKPLGMHVADFDDNGKSECIITWYPPLNDEAYPFASKTDLQEQLPGLKKIILKYEDYAHKKYQDLFPAEKRQKAKNYRADFLQSAILWIEDKGPRLEALPVEAQLSPVFAIIAEDMDGDDIKDLLLLGNFYGLKPEAGRNDANKGVFLKGNGHKGFDWLPSEKSGIFVEGEVRDAVFLNRVKGAPSILIARNNQTVKVFSKR